MLGTMSVSRLAAPMTRQSRMSSGNVRSFDVGSAASIASCEGNAPGMVNTMSRSATFSVWQFTQFRSNPAAGGTRSLPPQTPYAQLPSAA
jgi:hypothetical protein